MLFNYFCLSLEKYDLIFSWSLIISLAEKSLEI